MKVRCSNPGCNNSFEPSKPQKSALTKGYDIYCDPVCNAEHRAIKNRENYRKKKIPPEPRLCKLEECNIIFRPNRNHQLYCCIEHTKKAQKRDYQSRKKELITPPKTNRKCRKCGCDPSPNYIWCPKCHHEISLYKDDLDGGNRAFV